MGLSEAQRERWRAFVASGAPFAAYRQHNTADARAEMAETLLAVADHLAACETVLHDLVDPVDAGNGDACGYCCGEMERSFEDGRLVERFHHEDDCPITRGRNLLEPTP